MNEKVKTWISKNSSLIIVLIVVFGISGATLALASHTASQVSTTDAKIRSAEERAGRLTEARLCETFRRLSSLEPPPGNPSLNPSRAYLQNLHNELVQLGNDIGCTKDPPRVTTRQQESIAAKGYHNGHHG